MNLGLFITRKALFFSILLVISLTLVLFNIVGGAVDRDNDGYASLSSGGNDCFDEEYARFIEINDDSNCDPTDNPRYINLALDIADHSWIQGSDGTWHLFFSMGTPTVIQHYTTTDFTTFSNAGVALSTTTSNFDFHGLWAPHVMKNGSTYYLFYTGVTGEGSSATHDERIGLATSNDLTTWTRVTDPSNCGGGLAGDGCIMDCTASWSTWGTNGSYTEACRDPFVLWDADNSRWAMFVTSKHTSTREVISVAYSTDLIDWTMTGYINATKRDTNGTLGQLTGAVSENPFVAEYNGLYYLWFTDWNDTEDDLDDGLANPRTMQQYATSSTLTANSSGSDHWDYSGYTPLPGVNASEIFKPADDTWIMSQSISNGNVGDTNWSAGGYRSLIWHRVTWNEDGTFGKAKLTNLDCRVASANINPGATEICDDGVDNNCSGNADEDSVCNVVNNNGRGAILPPPPARGSGASTVSVDMGKKLPLATELNSVGFNILLYINSQVDLVWAGSKYNLKVSDLNIEQKKISLLLSNNSAELNFKLGEKKEVDLNNDGSKDMEILFIDLLVNRIELTVRSLPQVLGQKIVKSEEPASLVAKIKLNFNRNLKKGLRGVDVKELQKFLNQQGFTLSKSGVGSPGQETDYFGPATQTALINFQKKNKISPAAGYFGPVTRKHIEQL